MGTSLYRTSLLAVASALGVLFASAAAGDIYTWTDEKGTTVISDTPPANPKKATDLQVVVRDGDRKKRIGAREATPTEQKLLDRIDRLERQQANAQTYSAPPVAAPAPSAGVSYYTTPPPAPSYYDPYAYDPYAYYPSYYPSYYSGYYPGYSYFPGTVIVGRSVFRGRGHVGHRPVVTPHRGGAVVARGGFRR